MIGKKKILVVGIGAIVLLGMVVLSVPLMVGDEAEVQLSENQTYVYAYVSEINGNELSYSVLEESVVEAYLEQQTEENEQEDAVAEQKSAENVEKSADADVQENAEVEMGEMPERPSGVAPSASSAPDVVTTLIPVGVTVHTQADTTTTFQRLAAGDMIKILVETTEDGEEVFLEIWML